MTIHSSSLHFFRLPEDKARLAKTRSNVAIVQLSARPPHYVLQVGFAQLDYFSVHFCRTLDSPVQLFAGPIVQYGIVRICLVMPLMV